MANKNNLDIGQEAPHHTELASRYRIEGNVYDLAQIIATAKGDATDEQWNDDTMSNRLGTIKAYLNSVNAEKVEDDENTAGGDGTIKDGNGETIEHAAQVNGSDGNDNAGVGNTATSNTSGTSGASEGSSEADQQELTDLRQQNERLTDVVNGARNALGLPDDSLFEPSLVEGINGVQAQIKDIRDRLAIDGEADIIEAIDALAKRANEAEQRATVAEQDASDLRGEVQRLKERSTRDKPLHGHIDDLKAPY